MMTRTWWKFLFALSSFILCNTELLAFHRFFPPYYSKITTFAIELENSENMRKNLRTHQSEFRREVSAHESLTGTTPSGASFLLGDPSLHSLQFTGSPWLEKAITFSQTPGLLPVVECPLSTIIAACFWEAMRPCRLAEGLPAPAPATLPGGSAVLRGCSCTRDLPRAVVFSPRR